ncbi:hypothetical protein N9J53_01890 [Gammaproteobacteria bacterium]|nr:hypothetical protein [Gammaproteobacteria bacterium]
MTSTPKFLIFFNVIFLASLSSSDMYYPENVWELSSPESQNVDSEKVNKLINLSFNDQSTLGVVVIKNGKIIGERYADGYDSSSHGTSWSMAKVTMQLWLVSLLKKVR